MPNRQPAAARSLRGWKILATGAALGTLLVFAAPQAKADPVSKCVVEGVTTYSDKPCAEAAAERQLFLEQAPPVSVLASDAATLSSALRSARCDAARAELHNIDALTRQGQPPDMQAFLDARRQQKRNEQFRWRC